MLSALVGGREARGGLKLPPLSEKSAVKDISSFILPGGGFIANSAIHGLRQGRPCTSGIQLAELKRSLRTSDRKKSYKPDRSYCAPINPPPLIEFKGPEKLERRCETRCSTKEQENLTLVPWLRQAQNIPRPESRRPNSNFNLEEEKGKSSQLNLSHITHSMEVCPNGTNIDLLLPKKEDSIELDFIDSGDYKYLIQDKLEVVKEENWSDEEIEIVAEKFAPRYLFPRGSFFVQRTFPCCYSRLPTCPNLLPCMCCSGVTPVTTQNRVIQLKRCYVRMDDAKAVCDAFVAATSQYSHRTRNGPAYGGKIKKFRAAAADDQKIVKTKKQIT